jgi:hypothetical protein
MSLQAIRPYISARMAGLGYVEHTDPFNDENIPSSLLDNGFHQSFVSILGADKTNASQGVEATVEVKAFFKGFRNPEEALTQSIVQAEEIIADVSAFKNYSNNLDPILSVLLESLSFEPYSVESNDNIVQVTITFRIVVYICVE